MATTMITAGVAVNSSLLLEPAHQLTFWLEPGSAAAVRATLKLTNLSPERLAVFKVRTNRAEMFTVKPVHGVVPPGETREVVVTLVPAVAAQLAAEDPHVLAVRDTAVERFLIQSIERADDMRGFDVEDLAAFWRRVPRELPAASRVGCRFAVLPSDAVDPRLVATARCMDTLDKSRVMARQHEPDAFESLHLSKDAVCPPPPAEATSKRAAPTLFTIHPGDTLEFAIRPARPGRPAVLAPAAFFLTNKTHAHALAFKIKTTNHDGYFVKPSRGLIGPSNAQRIEVQPVKDDRASVNTTLDLQQREANDRFLVEIARVDIARYQELLSLDERERRRQLTSTVWDRAVNAGPREKAMMSCRIVGDAPPELRRLNTPPALAAHDISGDHDDDERDTWC